MISNIFVSMHLLLIYLSPIFLSLITLLTLFTFSLSPPSWLPFPSSSTFFLPSLSPLFYLLILFQNFFTFSFLTLTSQSLVLIPFSTLFFSSLSHATCSLFTFSLYLSCHFVITFSLLYIFLLFSLFFLNLSTLSLSSHYFSLFMIFFLCCQHHSYNKIV